MDQPRYFFIDEVTSIPEWQRGVKWVRDNTRAAEDCIVCTGSSSSDIAAGTAYLADMRRLDIGGDVLVRRLEALRDHYRLNPPEDGESSSSAMEGVMRIVCSDGLL